jgi:uncharacterized protein YukE
MNIEVNTDELKNCEMIFSKNSISLEEEIKYWEAQIEKLKNVWSGTEADIFYGRITSYLLKLKMIYETTNIFSKTIRNSYTMYEEKDKEFSSELRKENDQYDDDAFIRESNLRKKKLKSRRGDYVKSYEAIGGAISNNSQQLVKSKSGIESADYITSYEAIGGAISNNQPQISEIKDLGNGYYSASTAMTNLNNLPNVPNAQDKTI